jgi:hypothetical protein
MNLIAAIGKDVFIFEDKQYTDDDFQQMSLEELETFKAKLNVRASDISDKIRQEKRSEDSGWYDRKKYALSLTNKMIPYIRYAIKQRLKKERSLSDHFMDQAKILLPKRDFEIILNNAGKEMGLGGVNKCDK